VTPPVGPVLRAAALFALGLACLLPRWALAHGPQSSVYSKYEATTSGRTIAVVFAFDTPAMLRELQREAPVRVDRSNLNAYGDSFARYLFSHFTISNDGQPCEHPPALGTFFWDVASDHVIAVTKFECGSPLDDLVIRSVVTRDMPLRHDMVGDLRHGRALVRHFFSSTDVEAHVALSSLPQVPGSVDPGGDAGARVNVWIPEQERLYEELAAKTLNIDLPAEAPADVHPFATLLHFVREGILHIFTGYDHVAFILTLILAVQSWRQLGLVVTSFTAAHSVTLAMATLGVVTLPARFVEPLIALSVLIVAVDAIARPQAKARTSMAFGFGLVHGLGLSNVLRDLGLSGRELLPALLGFNVGVELGQLAIVAPMFLLVLRLRKRETAFARSRNMLCAGVAVAATIWLVVRVRAALFA
jgi:hydrogenase/urease accessory protein HupE